MDRALAQMWTEGLGLSLRLSPTHLPFAPSSSTAFSTKGSARLLLTSLRCPLLLHHSASLIARSLYSASLPFSFPVFLVPLRQLELRPLSPPTPLSQYPSVLLSLFVLLLVFSPLLFTFPLSAPLTGPPSP